MIPYLEIPPIPLAAGLEIHAFGLLTALGILLAAHLASRGAKRYAPGDDKPIVDAAPVALAGGLVGAHLLHVLGYHPELLASKGPLVLLRVWDGLSSMGGVLGGLLAVLLYFRWKGIRLRKYLDAFALGMAPGWMVARLGCFTAHDHPGVLTDFPLAVAYPGGARHDLGLYEAVLLGALSVVLWTLARRRRPEGFLMGVLAIGYAVPRFFLDFLRARDLPFVDGRILGLTPAQYVAFFLLAAGVWLLVTARSAANAGSGDGARDLSRGRTAA
jgi:phosphatidylglycerol:prolipoprotein diacylglycerol transferase